MYRKADRVRMEAIETWCRHLNLQVKGLQDDVTTIYKRTAAIEGGLDKLLQSHAALDKNLAELLESQTALIDKRAKELQLNCAAWSDKSSEMIAKLAKSKANGKRK